MKNIDLSGYTEADLLELNRCVVERIGALRKIRCRTSMGEFNVGDRVGFRPECGHEVEATVVRRNTKTVTVVTSEGSQWRVSPMLLTKLESNQKPSLGRAPEPVQGNLIDFAAYQAHDHCRT